MAKKKKKPQIRLLREATIETEEYKFNIKYKPPGLKILIPLMPSLEKLEADDESRMSEMAPQMIDILGSSIKEWNLDGDVSHDAIDSLPLDVVTEMFSSVMSGVSQEKN
jgi:hypothetical protein